MALGKQPQLKKTPFVMIYDFVGLDAMTRRPTERLITYLFNWTWGGGPRGRPPTEDLVLFIGEPDDIADRSFGFLLPNRRRYGGRRTEVLRAARPPGGDVRGNLYRAWL